MSNNLDKSTLLELFNTAEKSVADGNDGVAKILFTKLLSNEEIEPLACFRLGEIENRAGNIDESYRYHKRAFALDANLAKRITPDNHPYNNYVYKEVEEEQIEKCPLCGGDGELLSCYNMITNLDPIYGYNPIRIWKLCNHCNHLFASSFPKRLDETISSFAPSNLLKPKTNILPFLGDIISNIKKYAKGNRLLEVGVGGGEMTSVAKEFLFDITGVEIRPAYASNVSKMLNIPVHAENVMNFNTKKLFDVIILGDVIEHVVNPLEMLKKMHSLLDEKGVIWISTPNFESAFSLITKDADPMWRVCEHINYFSYKSLEKALLKVGFEIVDYKISRHYNGSMEVIAIKQ